MKRLLVILVAFVLLPASACSLRQKPSGEDFYAQGQLNFATKEYKAAIENYQQVIDKFPFSPYAEDAEMKIGLAYYQQKDYAEAIGALDHFQRMHPTSKNLELVTYYIGMSYYDQIGREDQDQGKTIAALKRFQELEQRFPEGDFAELAHDKVLVCREMLARNQMVVGNYYYKRANFRAAESRFAELLQKYPETPVAPDALFELGISLEREGKRYSAAQAFAAVKKHFPDTGYAKRAQTELAKLHEPIDTEEDPLPLVLAETGYGGSPDDSNADKVVVRQRSEMGGTQVASAGGATAYGADGLPILDGAAGAGASKTSSDVPAVLHAPDPSQPDLPSQAPGGPNMMRAPAPTLPKPTGSIAGAADAQARAMAGVASAAPSSSPNLMTASSSAPVAEPSHEIPADVEAINPSQSITSSSGAADAPPPEATLHQLAAAAPAPPAAPTGEPAQEPTLHEMNTDPAASAPPMSLGVPPTAGPATLKTIRLSSNEPPLSVVFELTGPVNFDKSIFKDCKVSSDSSGTTVTLNMQPIAHFAVVPLESPPRLLVTFTPQSGTMKTSAAN